MLDNNFKINSLAAFVKSTSNTIKAKYTLIDNLNKIEVNSKQKLFNFANKDIILILVFTLKIGKKCPCGQVDKALVSEARDRGFESLQG